jgi:low temperature requirement protein LtrA
MATASAPTPAIDPDVEPAETEHRVTPLELFFDLVFVLAITQVTQLLADDPTWHGLARGMLILGMLWWAWAAYAWLTNEIDPDEGSARLVMFMATAGMLIVALAVPGAFSENALEFAIAYTFVRAMHIALWAWSTDDPEVRRTVIKLAPTSFVGCALLFAASFTDGTLQGALWAVALVIDYVGGGRGGGAGYRLHPAHFVERHGLIIIIALGESIVAVGVGASSSTELEAGEIACALLGVVVAASLWWTYFDVTTLVAERKLTSLHGAERARLARDSFSYLHFPMVAGIVLLALGIKKTLEHTDHVLGTIPAVAICGGVGLFFLTHVARRLRAMHTFGRHRFVAGLLCFALIPLALNVEALITLAALAVVTAGLVGYEYWRFHESRAQVRAAAHYHA